MLKRLFSKKIPLVVLEGTIQSGARPDALNLMAKKSVLDQAFRTSAPAVGVFLQTPGGSPAHSSLLYKYLVAQKRRHAKRLLVFVGDVAASGGAYVSAAGDRVYVDENSIVGSVGVISTWFNVEELMKNRVSFHRRTAGKHKGGITAFEEPTPQQLAKLEDTQRRMHANFRDVMKRGRPMIADEVFEGDYYVGQHGIDVGLADAIGSPFEVLREEYPEYRIQVLGQRRYPFAGMFSSELTGAATELLSNRKYF